MILIAVCSHKKATKDEMAEAKSKGKNGVSVKSQKQESFYMCILVLCDGSCEGIII